MTACDICIIGLGPVGATLANLLGGLGLSVVVLEREGAMYPLPRAVAFDDEVMRVFETIGIAAEVDAVSRRSPGMRFIDAQGKLIVDWTRPQALTAQGWYASYRFHQPDLEQILRAALRRYPGVEVRPRCEVFSLEQTPERVRVSYEELATGNLVSLDAAYVVGCDGSRSLVRRSLGSALLHLGYRQQWLVVDVLLERELDALGDFSVQYCDPARPATYVRGVRNRRRWEISALPGEDPSTLVRPETVWRLLRPWIAPGDATIDRAAVYTFESAVAARWRNERVMIAGDAAHQTPPFLGQGMCAGIRDVANLAWKLQRVVAGSVPADVLDTYQSERDSHVRRYIERAIECGSILAAPPDTDEPERMNAVSAPLGSGLHGRSEAPVGSLAPQPLTGRGVRVDAAAGYGFALFGRPGFVAGLPPALRARLQRVGVCVIDDVVDDPAATGLAGAPALLVRPDRYVLAAPDSYQDLNRALEVLDRSHAPAAAAVPT